MPIGRFDFYTRPKPPSSEELATAYKPYIETCIAAFGVNRAMFESNFPPDGARSSYLKSWRRTRNPFARSVSKSVNPGYRDLDDLAGIQPGIGTP